MIKYSCFSCNEKPYTVGHLPFFPDFISNRCFSRKCLCRTYICVCAFAFVVGNASSTLKAFCVFIPKALQNPILPAPLVTMGAHFLERDFTDFAKLVLLPVFPLILHPQKSFQLQLSSQLP